MDIDFYKISSNDYNNVYVDKKNKLVLETTIIKCATLNYVKHIIRSYSDDFPSNEDIINHNLNYSKIYKVFNDSERLDDYVMNELENDLNEELVIENNIEVNINEKDRLQEMFDIQKKFNERLKEDKTCEVNEIDRIKELALGLLSEIDEVIRESNWKNHRKGIVVKSAHSDKMLEEITDCLKYVISLYTDLGFTADDIYREFIYKSDFVESRYDYEKNLSDWR